MSSLTPIREAMQELHMRRPKYFLGVAGKLRRYKGDIPRPNLLSETRFYDGERILHKILPPGVLSGDLQAWHDRFYETIDEARGMSPSMVEFYSEDILTRSGLPKSYRHWLAPKRSISRGLGINNLVVFSLVGAMFSGASVALLNKDSFLVTGGQHTWGIKNNKVFGTDTHLLEVSYEQIVKGKYWRGGSAENYAFSSAYAAACKAHDEVAKETMICAYWSGRDSKRLNLLFTSTRSDLWQC